MFFDEFHEKTSASQFCFQIETFLYTSLVFQSPFIIQVIHIVNTNAIFIYIRKPKVGNISEHIKLFKMATFFFVSTKNVGIFELFSMQSFDLG